MNTLTENGAPRKERKRRRAPAINSETRENQIINLAYNEAEKRIINGTATSQLLTHFLKLGTVKAQLENEKLISDLKVAEAKIKQIESQEEIKELYENALAAMRSYNGQTSEDDFNEEELY